jgi:hypothetical protein
MFLLASYQFKRRRQSHKLRGVYQNESFSQESFDFFEAGKLTKIRVKKRFNEERHPLAINAPKVSPATSSRYRIFRFSFQNVNHLLRGCNLA